MVFAVPWKTTVNRALSKTVGMELRKVGSAPAGRQPAKRPKVGKLRKGDRLLSQPTFVLCTLRSGSTLMRMLLNSHSQLHAPHEIHLRYVSVNLDAKWSERSLKEMGLDEKGLEYLLWDRVLHRELSTSGKPFIVDKTPNNVFIVDRLKECWPDARFIFLLRHPASIARSRKEMNPNVEDDKNVDLIRRYCESLENARQTYDGVTVRYEDLTTNPEAEMRRVCEFLDVTFEPSMLEYGKFDHGRLKAGLGDFKEKIRSGEVQPPAPLPAPEEVPVALRDAAVAWGYMTAEQAAQAAPAA